MSIVRSEGTTESERYLAKLADRSFLNLWSYPNLYIGKFFAGQGKELCDLLVVCGDHVIVFSDKAITWPDGVETELAWRRWYKRAVEKSVKQICGAARWISQYPDRIFLDSECKQKLPLKLPTPSRLQLHGVVVARGAGMASKDFFNGGTGSLMIAPDIKGDAHFKAKSVSPLMVGDVNPDGMFVHVLDDGSLDIVMSELDTITDLTDYLAKKELLVRSGKLTISTGEEDLLAYYMTHMESRHEHGFTRPDGSPLRLSDSIAIENVYSELQTNPQFIAKKQADEISYLWDNLIEAFTKYMLAGTTLVPGGEEFDLDQHEQGVRYMALVPRYQRRNFGDGIASALKIGQKHNRFVRAFISKEDAPGAETGFFFMTLQYPAFELDGGYEQYRAARHRMLEAYALSFLQKYPYLERIVGIATEPLPRDKDKRRASSEDLVLAMVPEWSDELLADLKERQELYDIMKDGRYREFDMSGNEWPELTPVTPQTGTMNRKQRRATAAKKRRKRKQR